MPTWNPADPCELATSATGHHESTAAHQALLDFLRLGPGRSFPALLKRYQLQKTAPTHSLGTLHNWSVLYAWSLRASAYDELEDERLQAEVRARRDAILQRRLALDFERIEFLASLFEKLNALAADEDVFWVRDVRLLHMPDGSDERVELRRFNGALVRSLRDILEDIARETGGRALSPRLPIAEEPALNMDYSFDMLSPAERSEFLRLQNKIFDNPIRPLK
jgi:hypothetical protein